LDKIYSTLIIYIVGGWPWHTLSAIKKPRKNILRRPTRVDNTADNADITQS